MKIWCRLCDWEAIVVYERKERPPLPLCLKCSCAFEVGQMSPDAITMLMDDYKPSKENQDV